MSEQIKITVVMDNEKQHAGQKAERILLTQDPFVTLMSVLLENHLLEGSLCGGRGECKRCAVQFLEGAPMPTPLERKHFSAEQLRQGYRLACIAKPRTDCTVRLLHSGQAEVPIITKTIPLSENIDLNGQRKELSENRIPDVIDYMIAVDLGTTTIAMQLVSMTTGEAVDTYCEHNPQRSYGADVLSRMQASCTGHREELQKMVCETLLRGLRHFLPYFNGKGKEGPAGRQSAAEAERGSARKGPAGGAARLCGMCIAGNTTMEHLLLGYDVQSLGRSPFTPVEIGVQETTLDGLFACLDQNASAAGTIPALGEGLEAGFGLTAEADMPGTLPVYLTPGIGAFVGGDIVAGLYALRMLPGFEDAGGVRFLIDLGTNGEMAITNGKRMLVTATAAGPAFEGGGESALIGTDRITLTASFLKRGILDETGLLAEPYFTEGVPVETGRAGMPAKAGQEGTPRMRKEEIRALQMAKAAIRAGIEILWQEMDCPRVDRVYLAGGFGYELDVEAAFAIGLLPARLRGRVEAVGNTSLAGAFLMGRALVKGRIDRKALEEMLSSETTVKSVNLAKRKSFAAHYLQYMNLREN